MPEQKSLKKNSFYSFFNAFTTLMFPLVTFPYASRILHPEGIGQVNFAVHTEGFFALIAGLGISSYATREAARIRDNKFELSKFCKEIITINFLSMLLAYIFLGLSLLFIPKFEHYKILILVRSTSIFFSTIGLEWLYTAEEDFKYITLRSLIFKFIGLAFLFIFVKSENDTVQYTIFGILTSVASNICNLIHSRKYIDYKQKSTLEFKKHLKYIFIFFGMRFVTSIYTTFDSLMIGFLSNDIQNGYYAAATKLNKLTLGLLTAATAVLLPRLSYYIHHDKKDEFDRLVGKSLSITVLLAIPMALGLILLAKPFVILFSGQDYIPAVTAMNIISPILVSIGIASITGTQVLPAIKKEKVTLTSYICGATINVTLNFIFIPKLGATGAAIGTLFAETTVALIQLIYLRHYLSKDLFINLIHSIISSIPIVIIILLIKYFLNNNVLIIILSILLSVIIYALSLFFLKNKYFCEYSIQIKNKVFNKNK